METVSVAIAKSKLSEQLRKVNENPVQITNNGKPVAVLVSHERYRQLEYVEDMLWAKMAEILVKQDDFVSVEESEALLDKIAKA